MAQDLPGAITDALGVLNAALAGRLHHLTAAELAKLAWCVGKTKSLQPGRHMSGLLPEEIVGALAGRLAGATPDSYAAGGPGVVLGSKAVANLLYGLAVMGMAPPRGLVGALAVAVDAAEDWVPQGAANSLWAVGKLGLKAADADARALLDALAAKLQALLAAPPVLPPAPDALIPQHLSNALHGMATAGYTPPSKLLEALCRRAGGMLDQFSPQEITNLVWGLSTMAKKGGEVRMPAFAWATMQHVADALSVMLMVGHWRAGLRPQTLSNLAWAYATLGLCPRRLFADLVAEALPSLAAFKPQELANLQYALALTGCFPGNEAMDAMAEAAAAAAEKSKPEELSATLWSWATLRFLPRGDAMEGVVLRALEVVGNMKTQELGNATWALGRLAFVPAAQFAGAVNASLLDGRRWERAAVQDVTNALWGLAVLGVLDEAAMGAACARLAPRLAAAPQTFAPENLVQVFVAHHHLRMRRSGGRGALSYEAAAAELLRRGAEENARQLETAHVSGMQADVAAALEAAGVAAEPEYFIDAAIAAVDLAVLPEAGDGGGEVAVEVDGASHFTVNPPHVPLGKSVLRWRALEAAGCSVRSVPFYAWLALPTAEDKVDYVTRLLECSSVWDCLTLPVVRGGPQAHPPPRNYADLGPEDAVAAFFEEGSDGEGAEGEGSAAAKPPTPSPASVVPLAGAAAAGSQAPTPAGPRPAVLPAARLNVAAAPFVFNPAASAAATAPPPSSNGHHAVADLKPAMRGLSLSAGPAGAASWTAALAALEGHLPEAGGSCSVPGCWVCYSAIDALWGSGLPAAQAQARALLRSRPPTERAPRRRRCGANGAVLILDLGNSSTGVSVLRLAAWLEAQRDALGACASGGAGSGADLADCRRVEVAAPGAALEALGTSLVAHRAPFKLHYEGGRAAGVASAAAMLCDWLFSPGYAGWAEAAAGGGIQTPAAPLSAARWAEVERDRAAALGDAPQDASADRFLDLFAARLGCDTVESREKAVGGAAMLLEAEAVAGRSLPGGPAAAAAAVCVARRQRGVLPWLPSGLTCAADRQDTAAAVAQLLQSLRLAVRGDATVAAAIA